MWQVICSCPKAFQLQSPPIPFEFRELLCVSPPESDTNTVAAKWIKTSRLPTAPQHMTSEGEVERGKQKEKK